ncbi:sulfotransferase [Azospirillum sp. B2RO_4]|uniref:sulfotransferase family protein n=1 Tax=Azospirillum sp. B2RO_4 TaxID=3027796 RepID=UPI003DA9982D
MTVSAAAGRPIAPVLVLSTGRCGSTMLSDLLNRHRDILSLSEFFVPLGQEAFIWKNPDGARFWRLLSEQGPAMRATLRAGRVVDEALYPYDKPGQRFTAQTMPPVMAVSLPHLTPDYEALYDQLAAEVPSWPRRPLADQYRAFFEHLRGRFGRRVWIERSGGSLMLAAKLLRLFPDARVIHVFRDGRDTAMSMAQHHNFRVLAGLSLACRRVGLNPWARALSPTVGHAEALGYRLMLRLLDTGRLDREGLPLAEFGRLWSQLIETGDAVLRTLPPDRLLTVRIEDLQNSPRDELRRLIRFVDPSLEDEGWLDAVSPIPRPAKPRFTGLPPDQLRALTDACAPGLDLLGYGR